MVSTPASQEVRRCAKCSAEAVVLVFEWKHSHSGFETGQSTRDYRCQACGARFSIQPKLNAIAKIVVGGLLSCAIFPLAFVAVGVWQLLQDKRNPVVPGAPRPVMKYRDGPPARQCASCTQTVTLKSVTRRTSRGLPMGTEYEYECAHCGRAFTLESPWGHLMMVLAGLLVFAISYAFLTQAESAGWRWGGSGVAALLGVFAFAQIVVRLVARVQNPVIDEAV
jgi:DNA-directed RNA polymerase subunit RPC12/RpoP